MAAGLGFKTFNTGDVLSAADVNGYLMQGVLVFASATARDAAITSPQEGQFAYLKDTNVTTYYTGSAWANLDTTGMTNPMTTTGDTIYSSSGSTPARLGIGSTGQVLTVAGGVPTWAAPASSGGLTLIQETVASALTGLSFSSISGSYKQLYLTWSGVRHSATGSQFAVRFNNTSGANDYLINGFQGQGATLNTNGTNQTHLGGLVTSAIYAFGENTDATAVYQLVCNGQLLIDNYASTTKSKNVKWNTSYYNNASGVFSSVNTTSIYDSTSAITSIDIVRLTGSATFSNIGNSSIRLYGIN